MSYMKPRKYVFNNSSITIIFGDITESKAEVIASSDDTQISMGGGVSRAIRLKGGEIIRQDAKKQLPARVGDVVLSTAGALQHQKYIFHCLTLSKGNKEALNGLSNINDLEQYILRHSIDKCFTLLHALDINSIAFPCIGAGSAHIPMTKVAETMADTIADNLCMTQKQMEVEIYLYNRYDLDGAFDDINPFIDMFEYFAIRSAMATQKAISDMSALSSEVVTVDRSHISIPRREDMKHRVFISYARKDSKKVDSIRAVLEKHSIDYWIDLEGIFSGDNYKEVIVDAIDNADAVIFVSSANSNESMNVIRELGYAVKQRKIIVPILLDDTQYAKSIRLDLADIDQINFADASIFEQKLIASLTYILNVK